MGGETIVVRRGEHGWQVGDEETADLTSAMVLADLLAADLGTPAPPPAGPPRHSVANHSVANHGALSEQDEAARLAVTVAQLEHALATRVRVEQAIGVLAERNRLRPRQAFDLLRSAARSGGRRVIEVAEDVVGSASNPLLPLPPELARTQPAARKRGPSPRHVRSPASSVR
jgi:ANTAR domain-containing protein